MDVDSKPGLSLPFGETLDSGSIFLSLHFLICPMGTAVLPPGLD